VSHFKLLVLSKDHLFTSLSVLRSIRIEFIFFFYIHNFIAGSIKNSVAVVVVAERDRVKEKEIKKEKGQIP
jgi:hypothetical protein